MGYYALLSSNDVSGPMQFWGEPPQGLEGSGISAGHLRRRIRVFNGYHFERDDFLALIAVTATVGSESSEAHSGSARQEPDQRTRP